MHDEQPDNAYDTDGIRAIPLTVKSIAPALSTKYTLFSKARGDTTIQIMADSQREFLGFYPDGNQGICELYPITGNGLPKIIINPNLGPFEMRVSSHGPMVRDAWNLESLTGDGCTLIIITREG